MNGLFQLAPEMEAALPVLLRLEQAGHEAVFVGGCVRDLLLGLSLKDVDIASPAQPEEVMSLFPGCIPTGLQHGTVTVRSGGQLYEVTTYRAEADYEDSRRPSSVAFIRNLEEDLLRRDFTINAMALDRQGKLRDPFNGREDLSLRRIRAVGHARERFAEDALRLLRGIRFASVYKLTFSHGTWKGLLASREGLRRIAMERVGLELDRMIGGGGIARAAALLEASDLPAYFKDALPGWQEAKMRFSSPESRSELAWRMELASRLGGADDGWAALFLLLGLDEATAAGWFDRLRYSHERRDRLIAILRMHSKLVAAGWDHLSSKLWTELVLDEGQASAEHWLEFMEQAEKHGLHAGLLTLLEPSRLSVEVAERYEESIPALELAYERHGIGSSGAIVDPAEAAAKCRAWLQAMPVRSLKELAVDGRKLQIELGRLPGPWLGPLLGRLLRETAHGKVANDEAALLAYARQLTDGEEQTT
ncbi:tRNA nucleotidyltransferase (CCA-adding enzyme) [Paenibacillaceae bacterium GAS479]|nr:tRNA nucleotidyltransferase (CCA-adding enzyme) [Paenibacillaceae bacterium GAS479]